jgi:hypothetical protein
VTVPRITTSTTEPAAWFTTGPPDLHGASAQVLVAGSRARRSGGVVVDPSVIALGSQFGVDVPRRMQRAQATGRAGEVVAVEVDGPDHGLELILVVGTGKGRPADHRVAAAAIARRIRDRDRVVVETVRGAGS